MPCLLCGSDGPFLHRYRLHNYRIERCQACRLTQLHPAPTPETVAALYDDAYYGTEEGTAGYEDYADQKDEYLLTFRDDIRRIRCFVSEGTVLDIGCGSGYFMQVAQEAGFEVYGTDLIESIVKDAQDAFPGRVFVGELSDIDALRGKTFDVIFASHLIEHILDPRTFVEELRAYLKPGGFLVFVTPNIRSLLAKVSGPRWVSFKIPEHVAYYDPATIRALFDRAGMETVAVDGSYQFYRAPFIAKKLRALISPLDKLVPPIERTSLLRDRIFRITSGSLRAIARKPDST